jgi:hypothetical protein
MTKWKRLQHALALVAGITLMLPSMAWTEEATASRPVAKAAKLIVPDIALNSEGAFKGTLVDGAKNPLVKTSVMLKKDGKLITTVETDDKGAYTVPSLKPGAYQLEILKQTVAVRLWKPAAAPPKAMKQLDMAYVPDANVVRAQLGYLDPVETSLLILGVAGVVLGGVAISELNQLEDDIQDLKSP